MIWITRLTSSSWTCCHRQVSTHPQTLCQKIKGLRSRLLFFVCWGTWFILTTQENKKQENKWILRKGRFIFALHCFFSLLSALFTSNPGCQCFRDIAETTAIVFRPRETDCWLLIEIWGHLRFENSLQAIEVNSSLQDVVWGLAA